MSAPKGPLALGLGGLGGLGRLGGLVTRTSSSKKMDHLSIWSPTTRVPMSSSDGSVSVPAAAPPSPLMQEEVSPEIRFLASPS